MRKSATAVALAVTAVLLTGCGGGDKSGDGGKDGNAKGAAADRPSAKPKGDGKPGGLAVGPTREVTIEVTGEGSTQVYYNLGDHNGGEQVSLPWKKTAKVTLKGAEVQVGSLVSVVPGSVKGADGMLKAASCVITVDGKKVADNQDGKLPKPCEYTLK
ncbi:hypothetical protein [Streptomyces griseocarneus]|uniref:hypothetical protein n=1 Tax=Streptomyces griseocarneus TaxID=51201 RepID=UPI00167E3DE7|nr:hypothetical protein [Streptomyces griseocarneus]MBZ6474780.1 hypothetical protein [Streptomyces griseocarneus]GHG48042.1 hypothetical protein GCM10018779_05970 [Streptomyces griseocarneus]